MAPRQVDDQAAAYPRRLLLLVVVGFAGVGAILGGGLTSDWPLYAIGMVSALAVVFLCGTGLWMRWPHGR